MTDSAASTQSIPTRLEPLGKGALPRTRGLGTLSGKAASRPVTLPLAKVEIAARVAERVASVRVTETFRNALDAPLEAVYTFPLPGGAAVCELELRVGGRVVRGHVEGRAEARREYRQALESGRRTALLEQERDGVFTVQVGNIAPGEDVEVRIAYSEPLPAFEDGATEVRLPLVVAPRYMAGAPLDRPPTGDGVEADTTAVPDASRISPPRLVPGFDPRIALSIEVEVVREGAEGEIEDLACSQHATRTSSGARSVTVRLAREDEPLDRDFVLRWRLAGPGLRSTLLTARGPDGARYAMLSIVPPRREGFLGLARDVAFVLDSSGSMEGVKMADAGAACAALLRTLGPRDRFTIIAFDDDVETIGEGLLPADEAGIARGEEYLRSIAAGGGTELALGLDHALTTLAARGSAEGDRAPVIVLITDGQVGDEAGILRRIQRNLKEMRLFSVGVDTAVNRAFLSRLAALGGGTAAFVEPGAGRTGEALRAIAREIGTPLFLDLTLEGPAIERGTLAPARLPDLFAGRAATVFFRVKGGSEAGSVRLRGRSLAGPALDETVLARDVALPAIPQLWAKARVGDLEDAFRGASGREQEKLRSEIVEVAKRHTLLTRFTAFVAVDEVGAASPGERRKLVQPVATPKGWEEEGRDDLCEDLCLLESEPDGEPAEPAPVVSSSACGGSFEIGRQLGEGGMGVVYKGTYTPDPRVVPLPPLPPGVECVRPSLRASGMTLGTVVYMSPEQLMGRDLGPSADVYAVGATLYEMCTGKLPFYDENEMQLMKMIMKAAPTPPRAHDPGLPKALEAVILRALEKDRTRRYASARDLSDALAAVRATLSPPPRPAPVPAPLHGPIPVAIKQLHPNLTRDPGIRQRFVDEARYMARLRHPNILGVLDCVTRPDGLFTILDLVEGSTVETLLEEAGVLPPARAIDLVLPVLSALQFAHERGIIHGDVKPSNIMVCRDGIVKIMDFRVPRSGPAATAAASPPPAPARAAPGLDADPGDIALALDALARALAAAEAEVQAGSCPGGGNPLPTLPAEGSAAHAARTIDAPRRELLDLLSRYELALHVPALQRVLRGPLAELAAALRTPGGPGRVLEELLRRARRDIESAAAEARPYVAGKGKAPPFWEATV